MQKTSTLVIFICGFLFMTVAKGQDWPAIYAECAKSVGTENSAAYTNCVEERSRAEVKARREVKRLDDERWEKEKIRQNQLAEQEREENQRRRDSYILTAANHEKAGRCELATAYILSLPIRDRPTFSEEACIEERRFRQVLSDRNPQAMYLAAVKYESNGERPRAKSIYIQLIDKHSSSPFALKAADRITALADVTAIERSNQDSKNAAERRAADLRESIDNASSDRRRTAQQSCQIEENSCYSRGGKNCYRNCQSLR